MEHQVFVPVAADDLRAVLRDPVRVARCVPGLQQDADEASGPLAGRLKLRVGGHTVTYRGALAVSEPEADTFAIEGEGTEVRGSGAVKFGLTLRLEPAEGGTRLHFTAGAGADGRAAAFDPAATVTAVQRLLDRAAAQLTGAARGLPDTVPDTAPDTDTDTAPDTAAHAADAPGAEPASEPGPDAALPPTIEPTVESTDELGPDGTGSVFETDVPPPSLDPFIDAEFGDESRPPAEAAHARRTMIGRSAEEVDHAPPRGRYAPVPAPDAGASGGNLRWLAPAALALAGAVVFGRALRRRR
ncbi:SRPBCC domain-containing protein [Streptomyces sp. NPDC051211]|uniref:SRPBCC domain-containing protein n=1 Tax=Streptomyces sp. NPDC051211 TaxID=3154643 RepID=UPI003450964C